MNDVVNINELRAHKEGDSKLWSPQEALEAVLRDIKSEKIKPISIAIHYWHDLGDGDKSLRSTQANLDTEGHIVLLEISKTAIIQGYLGLK